ncbi:MAG: Aldo/keto reductase [uncultured Sulfurovum sp.]|uniref:Aldo/keto reductase n=1 Tax=uncultured Sulfurovum sp. TaxID=269237 RepID=A0A6S6SX08_9BACT|nr:MAG: Aldo/keto reductase [uncultured Sulfurovum sp.]
MEHINLANTDMNVSRLGFGTASLHHNIKESRRLEILSSVYNLGFTYFDTARIYGEGMAEKTLGKFLSDGKREKVILSSKFGLVANPLYEKVSLLMYGEKVLRTLFAKIGIHLKIKEKKRQLSVEEVSSSLSKSLTALQTTWLDIFYLHEAQLSDLEDIYKLVPWLEAQKKNGKIRYLGLSGDYENCMELYLKIPDLFDILQIEDSIESTEADILTLEKIPLDIQIRFGYLRNSQGVDKKAVFKEVLKRNKKTLVLLASNNVKHITELVALIKR